MALDGCKVESERLHTDTVSAAGSGEAAGSYAPEKVHVHGNQQINS